MNPSLLLFVFVLFELSSCPSELTVQRGRMTAIIYGFAVLTREVKSRSRRCFENAKDNQLLISSLYHSPSLRGEQSSDTDCTSTSSYFVTLPFKWSRSRWLFILNKRRRCTQPIVLDSTSSTLRRTHTRTHARTHTHTDSSSDISRVARLATIQLLCLPEWINRTFQNQTWQRRQTELATHSTHDKMTAAQQSAHQWSEQHARCDIVLLMFLFLFNATLLSDGKWHKGQECAKLIVKGMWNSPGGQSYCVSHIHSVLALLFWKV